MKPTNINEIILTPEENKILELLLNKIAKYSSKTDSGTIEYDSCICKIEFK